MPLTDLLGRVDLKALIAVRPRSFEDVVRILIAYVRAACTILLAPERYLSLGYYIPGIREVHLRFDGFVARVRPKTDDITSITLSREPGVVKWFRPQRGDVVVDVGAHIGAYALRAAASGARVLAIEPNPLTAGALRRNLELNKFGSVKVEELAVGAEHGTSILSTSLIASTSSSLVNVFGNSPYRVSVVPLDRIVDPWARGQINWLKVDVEGYEVEVLKGARSALMKCSRVIIEVGKSNIEACSRLLTNTGFKVIERLDLGSVEYWLLESQRDRVIGY